MARMQPQYTIEYELNDPDGTSLLVDRSRQDGCKWTKWTEVKREAASLMAKGLYVVSVKIIEWRGQRRVRATPPKMAEKKASKRSQRGELDPMAMGFIIGIIVLIIWGTLEIIKTVRGPTVPCTHCVCVCGDKDVCEVVPSELVCADAMLRELAPWCKGSSHAEKEKP